MDFEQALRHIDEACQTLGHQLGYRFLLTSRENFSSEVLYLGLNPGGNFIPDNHPQDSCESGPAHLTENWDPKSQPGKSPLQVQMNKLFCTLNKVIPGCHDWNNEALLAYFIPFRSPDFASLIAKRESIRFSLDLWAELLKSIKPKLIICLGNEVSSNLTKIYGIAAASHVEKLNWGTSTGTVNIYKDGRRILRLPHLSRYKIFSRPSCAVPITNLFVEATKNWE